MTDPLIQKCSSILETIPALKNYSYDNDDSQRMFYPSDKIFVDIIKYKQYKMLELMYNPNKELRLNVNPFENINEVVYPTTAELASIFHTFNLISCQPIDTYEYDEKKYCYADIEYDFEGFSIFMQKHFPNSRCIGINYESEISERKKIWNFPVNGLNILNFELSSTNIHSMKLAMVRYYKTYCDLVCCVSGNIDNELKIAADLVGINGSLIYRLAEPFSHTAAKNIWQIVPFFSTIILFKPAMMKCDESTVYLICIERNNIEITEKDNMSKKFVDWLINCNNTLIDLQITAISKINKEIDNREIYDVNKCLFLMGLTETVKII